MTGAFALPLAARARAFWLWWSAELAAAVPPALRPRRRSARADVHAARGGILVERIRQGESERFAEERPLAGLDEAGWAELAGLLRGHRQRVILSPPDVHFARIELPAAARAHLRAAVAIQLNQHAPVEPERLLWNFRIEGTDARSVTVLVAMAHAGRAAEIAEGFAAQGLAEPALVARRDGEELEIAAGRPSPEQRRNRRIWTAAALLLLSVPGTTWLAASASTALAENRIESLRAEVEPKMRAERIAAREEQVRRALKTVFELPAATAAIEGLALGLPDTAFAVAAERRYDGAFSVETQTSDRAALESAMAEAPLLAGLDPAAELPGEDGRIRLSFRGRPQ